LPTRKTIAKKPIRKAAHHEKNNPIVALDALASVERKRTPMAFEIDLQRS
jgi:hypothetical protein